MDYLYKSPIAMPRGTHYGNNYWIFYSRKLNRRVTAFSNLEYENLITLEMSPNVIHYCEQPCEQTVIINGVKHTTVFDVYVVYADGREEFQEVKYAEELDSDSSNGKRSRLQISIQKAWCDQNNFAYHLRTDKDIEVGKYTLRNLCYLCAKSRRNMSVYERNDNALLSKLSECGPLTIGQLFLNGYITSESGMDYLADLFYRGKIVFSDIDNEHISNSTGVMNYGK